ncbi:MAG: class I SAM-dependent methyltransferase [Acidimicrobiales bacterium]|nr:class I SAM-dependent methyltransferase [Acidimicrobiales bacterium]
MEYGCDSSPLCLCDRRRVLSHWFEPIADHLGSAYLRYSFTRGTEQEVRFLVDAMGLQPGDRVLDVGCGPGRHAHALGRLGIEVVGVDIAERFIALARQGAPTGVTFVRGDARNLDFEGEFDAAISLCQGAFGLSGGPASAPDRLDPDLPVLQGMARAIRPGGRVAFSAFSAYFQVRYLEETDEFDADRGVNRERTTVLDEQQNPLETELWTSCFTPRELRFLVAVAGLSLDAIFSVTPGRYAANPPDLDHPEFLVLASRPF